MQQIANLKIQIQSLQEIVSLADKKHNMPKLDLYRKELYAALVREKITQANYKKLQKQFEQQAIDLRNNENLVVKLSKQSSVLKSEIDSLKKNEIDCKKRSEQYLQQIEKRQLQIKELKNSIELLIQHNDELQESNQTIGIINSQKNQDIEMLRDEIQEARAGYEQAVNKLKNTVADQSKQISRLDQNVKQSEKKLIEQSVAHKAVINSMDSQNLQLKMQYQEQIGRQKADTQKYTLSIVELNNKIRTLNQQINLLKSNINKQIQEHQEVNRSLQKSATVSKGLERQLRSIKQKLNQMQEQYQTCKSEKEQLYEAKRLLDRNNKAQAKIINELNKKIQSLQQSNSDVNQYKQQSNRSVKQIKKKIQQLNIKLKQGQSHREDLKKQIQSNLNVIGMLKNKLQLTENAITKLKEQNKELTEQIVTGKQRKKQQLEMQILEKQKYIAQNTKLLQMLEYKQKFINCLKSLKPTEQISLQLSENNFIQNILKHHPELRDRKKRYSVVDKYLDK